jgi:predicted nuclease of predicted toxin-antitoxin system
LRKGLPLTVLLDEGAPVLVAEPFETRGHQVIYHQDVLSSGAKDALVCATAMINNAALVAVDRDMRQMAKRFGNPVEGGRYARLNLIFLNCNGVLAPNTSGREVGLMRVAGLAEV